MHINGFIWLPDVVEKLVVKHQVSSEARTRDPIPEFNTLKEMAEFWDTHSTAEYFDLGEEAHFEVRTRKRPMRIALLPELREQIEAQAHARGVTTETLVNWWIAERLQQAA